MSTIEDCETLYANAQNVIWLDDVCEYYKRKGCAEDGFCNNCKGIGRVLTENGQAIINMLHYHGKFGR